MGILSRSDVADGWAVDDTAAGVGAWTACMTYDLEDLGRTAKVTENIDIYGASIPLILFYQCMSPVAAS